MLLSNCGQLFRTALVNVCVQTSRGMAKRKGFRIKAALEARKRANARKLAEKLAGPKVKKWVPPHLLIDKSALNVGKRRYEPDPNVVGLTPVDNVFPTDRFARIGHSIEEIHSMAREICHETVYDKPDALLTAKFDLDLRTKKKTKFIEKFDGFLDYEHAVPYKHQRRLLVIAKKQSDRDWAMERGAVLAGHSDLIKMIEKGTLKAKEDFDALLCHSDSILDLAPVRGILRTYFPSKSKGNFGSDLNALFERYERGFDYELRKDEYDRTYGTVQCIFGRVSMPTEHIKANLIQLLKSVESNRKKDAPGDFFHQVTVEVEPSPDEVFRVRHWELLDGYKDPYVKIFNLEKEPEEAADEEAKGEDDEDERVSLSKL